MASQADVRYVDNAIEAQAAAAQDPAWWNLVGQFKGAADAMERAYGELLDQADYVAQRPALQARFDALLERATNVRSTVAAIRAQLDSAVDWFRSMGAAVGLSGLGVLPVLGIAAIAAAVALVVKWTTDTVKFLRVIAEQRRLEAAGVAPERAADIVRGTAAAAAGTASSSWLLPAAVLAIGGYFVWTQMRSSRR